MFPGGFSFGGEEMFGGYGAPRYLMLGGHPLPLMPEHAISGIPIHPSMIGGMPMFDGIPLFIGGHPAMLVGHGREPSRSFCISQPRTQYRCDSCGNLFSSRSDSHISSQSDADRHEIDCADRLQWINNLSKFSQTLNPHCKNDHSMTRMPAGNRRNSRVTCDGCRARDIRGHGVTFCCSTCNFDYCFDCAVNEDRRRKEMEDRRRKEMEDRRRKEMEDRRRKEMEDRRRKEMEDRDRLKVHKSRRGQKKKPRFSLESMDRCTNLLERKKATSEPTNEVEVAKSQKILRGLQKNPQFPEVVFHDLLTKVPTGQALVLRGQWRSQDVAIKLYLHEGEAFRREKSLLESAASHPNIMRILTSFESPRQAMVFPLAQKSLGDEIEDRALLIPLAKQYGKQILTGLIHLHSCGIVHLDLKCDNILINHRNVAMITDFGLASRFTGNDPVRGVGTPPFMAPECLLESPSQDLSKVDSYAFGMLFYEMLRGDYPWAEVFSAAGGDCEQGCKEIWRRVVSGDRPPLDSRWPSSVKVFLAKSWEQESSRRGSCGRLLTLIEDI
jgi:hypothetical protein